MKIKEIKVIVCSPGQNFVRRRTTSSSATGRYDRGYLYANESPGHGTDIDEDLAAKYPYAAAYLPVARLEDGSMTSW